MTDNNIITHPNHYNWHPSGVECKEICDDLPRWLGDAISYIWRRNHKGQPLDDRRKALERLNEYTPERTVAIPFIYPTQARGKLWDIPQDPDPLIWKAKHLILAALYQDHDEAQAVLSDIKATLEQEIKDLETPQP